MAFYNSDDFIEAFRNGGCFIFEGEEGNPDVTEEDPEDTSVEEVEENSETTEENPEKSTEETPEEPTEDDTPTPEVEKVNTAENVNSDSGTEQKRKMNADQIVKAFMDAKQLGPTLQYAKKCLGKANSINLKMVEPYIRAAVEKFCNEQFTTTVEDIASAINTIVKSLGVKAVNKQKAMAAKAEKEQQKKEEQSGGEGGEAPAEGSGEVPAEEAPSAEEGGEEAEG